MPSAVPQLYQYTHVPETQENLEWADCKCLASTLTSFILIVTVPNIDLSKYGTPEGNAELAETLIEAIRTKGFFYVTNFGVSQEAVDRQFALGQKFYELPLEEKLKYEPDLDGGDYNGYRPAGRRILSGGLKDKTEVWNMASKLFMNLVFSDPSDKVQPTTDASLKPSLSSSRPTSPRSNPSPRTFTTRSSTR
jgi:isopenicillin N synthase-like dioxygenase